MKSLREGTRTTIVKYWWSSTHLQLRTKCCLQNASSSNYWNINNYRTIFGNNYWSLTWWEWNAFSMKQKIASKLKALSG